VTAPHADSDAEQLARFGYRQELRRVLSLFENFGVAFCYISPVVGIYSLFVLGLGSAGPRYLWLMPIVVAGQMLVALIFAELASSFPVAGALYQWAKNLVGKGYGWFVGWTYGWALLLTIASVDTGVYLYGTPLVNKYLHTHFDPAKPNTILGFTLGILAIQTIVNVVGVRWMAWITKIGVFVEIAATFGLAILLGIHGFHHGLGYLFSTEGTQLGKTNPLGADFAGKWWLGAAFVAVLAHVYIFYGFESAGDVAEEVVDARRRVPKAITSSLLVGGITSFVLVAALILAIPKGGFGKAVSGGINFIIVSNITSSGLQDFILLLIVFAFFSCGVAIQAAAARLIYSYSRDRQLPASGALSRVSPRFKTPVNALLVATVVPALFSLLVHYTPSKSIHFLFITYPAKVNALFILVSFAVSGIYLAFQMVVIAAIIARVRGWQPTGFNLGRWAPLVYAGALVYGVAMLVNILLPTGLTSPRALFNYDWMTLAVVVVIAVLGILYYLAARPDRKAPPLVGDREVAVRT
jgi:amino acid transporter